jgi:hypothetical protein
MCQKCLDVCQEVFPEIPDEEIGDFLINTTCYPFGMPEDIKVQLLDNKRRMTTNDWHECYVIVDTEN